MFVFQLNDEDWKQYDWSFVRISPPFAPLQSPFLFLCLAHPILSPSASSFKLRLMLIQITTMAAFGTFDPQMVCTAHAAGARVVLNGNFDVTHLNNDTMVDAWIAGLIQV